MEPFVCVHSFMCMMRYFLYELKYTECADSDVFYVCNAFKKCITMCLMPVSNKGDKLISSDETYEYFLKLNITIII